MVLHSSISSLVETISKKPIPPHVKYITLEIMAEDETEEDVEVGPGSTFKAGFQMSLMCAFSLHSPGAIRNAQGQVKSDQSRPRP